MKSKKFFRKSVSFFSKNFITKLFLKSLSIDTVFLNYHRVISDEDFIKKTRPNNDLIVSESVFEKQIHFLTNNFNVISINDIHKNLQFKKKIIITFDDGYLDNYEIALPILKKYNCPAIIYIVTSFLDNKNCPWWLKIWKIIEQNKSIIYDKKEIDVSNIDLKIKIYNYFCKKIFLLKNSEQFTFFNKIRYNSNEFIEDNSKDFLSKEDLLKISKNDLIDIGCHSHYHQNLKILNEEELNEDIGRSKLLLEKIIGKKVIHFSIPFGTNNAFSEKSIELLKKLNFKTIVTTNHGNFDKKELFKIPRIGVGNNDLENTLHSKAIGFDSLINKIFKR